MSSSPPPLPPTLKYRVSTPAQATVVKPGATPPPIVAEAIKKRGRKKNEALFRVAIVVILLSACGLGYWSFFHYLAPLQKRAQAMVGEVSKKSTAMDELDRRWPADEAEKIRGQYREVYMQLFSDEDSLTDWLGDIQRQASPLGLDIQVGFGKAIPQEGFATNLVVIPASISLEVQPKRAGETEEGEKSAYDRMLMFAQGLSAHGKRADLAELNVTGGVNSISRALLVFNLWAGDVGADAHNEVASKEGAAR